MYQRIQKPSSWNPPIQEKSAQVRPPNLTSQAQQNAHRPPTQEELNNEAFNQTKFEALGLQLKHERGSITPVEQGRLGVLQAKMDDFWAQKLEQVSRFDRNLTNIPAHAPGQPQPNRTGLPDRLKTGIENLSGIAMDDVRVHYNSAQPAQLQALAYTQGTDIHVAPGQEGHLAHEAWHVVQQAQGRVQPTMQMKSGILINDADGLEKEADLMGQRALHHGLEREPGKTSFQTGLSQRSAGLARSISASNDHLVVQRIIDIKDNEQKLSFVIDECGRIAKDLFTNATEDQIISFIQDINLYWRQAYAQNKKSLDLAQATKVLSSHYKELLITLGKAQPAQLDYQRLANVIETTFSDETGHRFGIATKKENIQLFPPGTEWWLDKLNSETLIVAEDKSQDDRLMANTSQNHIVKTGADKPNTATALFEIDQKASNETEINQDDRVWELHGHVTEKGDVEFAHTKANGVHKVTVNQWFENNIDESDRTWEDP